MNVGDTLNYNLFLHNNSKRSYCYGSGYYISKESCEQYGHEWRLSTADEVVYKNLIIEAEVPENTEFISCNYSCKYDSNSRKVTWENTSDLKNTYYRAYTYKVKVMSGDKVINEGMKITTQNSNVLQMGKIETNVNPTLSKLNVIDLAENIKKFKKLLDDDIIEHSNSSTKSDYNLDDLNEKVGISAFGFVENIYYNTLNIDLGYLSTSNIKNAIFNVDSKSNYAKKTEEEIEALADENYKNINKMLVKGFYGGRYLRGNDNKDRKGRLRISDLEIGDIIVPYNTTTSSGIASNAAAIMYLGTFNDSSLNSKNSTIKQEYNSYFIKFNSNGITLYTQNSELSSYTLFNELYSKDLFVVLRPTQLYGTTVNYENVENVSETVSVENGTYQHLKQNSSFKLTLDSGENDIEEINAPYTLSWYKDKDYKYRLNSGDSLINENSHSVYAKVKYTTHTLPSPKKVGYTFKGWYDKDDDKKVANSGDNYEIKKITTLYADWELIIPNIEQTSNNKYIINDSYIEKIQVKTDLKGLELGLEDYYTYKVYNRNYQEKSNGNIATGDKINIYLNDDTLVNSYTAVIKGDITGTGEVTIADVAKLFQYYRGKITMEEMFQKAGNMVTADNEIKINDVAKLYQYIRGKINSLEG